MGVNYHMLQQVVIDSSLLSASRNLDRYALLQNPSFSCLPVPRLNLCSGKFLKTGGLHLQSNWLRFVNFLRFFSGPAQQNNFLSHLFFGGGREAGTKEINAHQLIA